MSTTDQPSTPAPSAPEGCVLVHAAALNLVRACLRRDAEKGMESRREILELLDEQTYSLPANP